MRRQEGLASQMEPAGVWILASAIFVALLEALAQLEKSLQLLAKSCFPCLRTPSAAWYSSECLNGLASSVAASSASRIPF